MQVAITATLAEDPSISIAVRATVQDNQDGTFVVNYVPSVRRTRGTPRSTQPVCASQVAGRYVIRAFLNDKAVARTPLSITAA